MYRCFIEEPCRGLVSVYCFCLQSTSRLSITLFESSWWWFFYAMLLTKATTSINLVQTCINGIWNAFGRHKFYLLLTNSRGGSLSSNISRYSRILFYGIRCLIAPVTQFSLECQIFFPFLQIMSEHNSCFGANLNKWRTQGSIKHLSFFKLIPKIHQASKYVNFCMRELIIVFLR